MIFTPTPPLFMGTYATWDPSNKDASITLSNGNLTATTTAAVSSVRATIGKPAGKWQWEITLVTVNFVLLGIETSIANLANYPGSDANGWGYFSSDGHKYHAGDLGVYGSPYIAGDTITFTYDGTTLTAYKNGVSQGGIAIAAGTWYPAMGSGGGASGNVGILNAGATPLLHPVAGFNAGLYL